MSYTYTQAISFINHIAPIMYNEAKSRGYKNVSAAIAQAIIEGAAGTSSLAKKYHNHWGLKCGSSWKGKSVNLKTKEEYTVGTLTTIKDNFRAYDSDEEGVKGYYDFISTKRYQGLYSIPLKDCTTYKQYAEALKRCGYATSSSYINTLCKTVEKYDLTKYDSGIESAPKTIDVLAQECIDGFWGTGTTRMMKLTQAGFDYNAVQKRVNELVKGNK